jgi:ABC-type glycerol-3-phosphate transport system substrate-binding protein
VINAKASAEKQEALHDLYKFMMSDPGRCLEGRGSLHLRKEDGWADNPEVQKFPYVNEIIRAKDEGVFLPRSLVFNELADSMHRAVQKVMLSKADIKQTLDEAAAEVDRATAAYKADLPGLRMEMAGSARGRSVECDVWPMDEIVNG